MSRFPDSTSPRNSNLPRRTVLRALMAAPTALAAATGQAFSFPQADAIDAASLAAAMTADPRFAQFDRLVAEIVDLDVRQDKAFDEYDDETRAWCAEESKEEGASPWVVLWSRLVNEDMAALAAEMCQPPRTFLDVVLQAKIADYYFAIGDADFDEVNDICPAACRHTLESWGIKPLTPIAELRARTRPAVIEQADEEPKSPPRRSNTGNLIARIRRHGSAHDAAIRFEASLEDDTPESDRAIAVTNRRLAELEALRDEIIAGLSGPYDPDSPYAMGAIEQVTVLCELIGALCPWFWTDQRHSSLGPVLIKLQKLGTTFSETYLEQSVGWSAAQGGANV